MIQNFSEKANLIFSELIEQYHIADDINQPYSNPFTQYPEKILYQKCWIDTVQWHVEDLIRDPEIEPVKALEYKRLIDRLNQQRTDTVEKIDDYFLDYFSNVSPKADAKINTESPAWAIDRLSILSLKIYHMQQETLRTDIDYDKKNQCLQKLELLKEQQTDLSRSINELLLDIAAANKKMKVYRQVKMYNDPELNPVLYSKKS